MIPQNFNRSTNVAMEHNTKIDETNETMSTEEKKNKDLNATIGNIVLGEFYWTYNVVYLPIQVKILEIDEETRKARIEQGWIDFDRLYNSEDDCPQR